MKAEKKARKSEVQMVQKELEVEKTARTLAEKKKSELGAQVVELERRLKSSAGEVQSRGKALDDVRLPRVRLRTSRHRTCSCKACAR